MTEVPRKVPCQCVYRALMLLETVAAYPSARLTDLANETGLNKATAYRLLTTMQARGFVDQSEENQEYFLGPRAAEIAQMFLDAVAASDDENGSREPETLEPAVIIEGSRCADEACDAEDCM